MKYIIINGWGWWLDTSTNTAYENKDKTGAYFYIYERPLTSFERSQIVNQIRYSQPMIKH